MEIQHAKALADMVFLHWLIILNNQKEGFIFFQVMHIIVTKMARQLLKTLCLIQELYHYVIFV